MIENGMYGFFRLLCIVWGKGGFGGMADGEIYMGFGFRYIWVRILVS